MTEFDAKAVAERALPLVDLTNLNDDCTAEDVTALCKRTVTDHGSVAAVCIWPRFVSHAKPLLDGSGVQIATVVNFPGGGEDTVAVVQETRQAVADGAGEIDLVMPYRTFLSGRPGFAETQIARVKDACGDAKLKVILESGEIEDPLLIHAASKLAIDAGADFIKTSTGKVKINATLKAAEIMLTVIEEHWRECHEEVGFKAAGGIRTVGEAAAYLNFADRIMGPQWACANTFRFGASGLLDALLAAIDGGEAATGEGY
ncbi:deoxyribose-phosphate aldolase [Stappia sp. GBMRC 2046]|uniref:Deoxyribose-phosphate aldolase n=1 Tax=Stappia sediminis TaxID=2692190 RepID=A0A7X3LWN8_9HYPH|nr:deoxyribose-phosphate aldolase [Stappia sediminis]MXN66442.1 deoxyribose-phosphate aldolase [Stappia sediminis]